VVTAHKVANRNTHRKMQSTYGELFIKFFRKAKELKHLEI